MGHHPEFSGWAQASRGTTQRGDQTPPVLGMGTSSTQDTSTQKNLGYSRWLAPVIPHTPLSKQQAEQELHPRAQSRKLLVLCRAESPLGRWDFKSSSPSCHLIVWPVDAPNPQPPHTIISWQKDVTCSHSSLPAPCLKLSGCWWGNESALLYLSLHHFAVCEDQ